ncbi:YsnF/AvaK domain-containing protein [Thermithiobacillus plumbiphilus]|uniref:YsnF/AvaK domain-containing protein n=1 Tax=Thermithiobacillus plumbiphilus TaxID=1729899 RepID=A0ABU9D7A6_9PROT
MSQDDHAQVHGKDGWQGWLEQPFDLGREAQVRLEDGTVLVMPADWLEAREDGSYFVPMERPDQDGADQDSPAEQVLASTVVPVIEEVARVDKRRETTGGVRIHKRVREREETVRPELLRESVSVERVAIGQFVDAPSGPHQEGDTLVVPIFEEVLVVEKRLRLKEEVRITRTRHTETQTHTLRLREEHVSIEALVEESDSGATRPVPPKQ